VKARPTRAWLGLLLSLLLLGACATPPPVPVAAPNAFAWVAESPVSGAGRIFLMGSMHLGKGPVELGPVLSQAFADSDLLVMEIDPDEVGLFEMIQLTGRYAQLPRGETLGERVSAETYVQLLAWCDRRDQPVSTLISFQAWFAAMMVEMKENEVRGFRAEYGSEAQFGKLARKQKKRIESLETAEEQMQILASASLEAQEQMLAAALEASGADFEELIAIFASGDEAGMFEVLMRDMGEPGAQDLFERIVFERNVNMATRLHQRTLDGRDRFVLVGAAHLVGDRGIPSLLAERGYTLRRVESRGDLVR
jgi:uncharacterized protein YbaP (TraB family)